METTGEGAIATVSHSQQVEAAPLTLRELVWRRFRRHKMAMAGVVMLILLVL